jgi:hypothetical protein
MSGHPIITTIHAQDIEAMPERIARLAMMGNERLYKEELLMTSPTISAITFILRKKRIPMAPIRVFSKASAISTKRAKLCKSSMRGNHEILPFRLTSVRDLWLLVFCGQHLPLLSVWGSEPSLASFSCFWWCPYSLHYEEKKGNGTNAIVSSIPSSSLFRSANRAKKALEAASLDMKGEEKNIYEALGRLSIEERLGYFANYFPGTSYRCFSRSSASLKAKGAKCSSWRSRY